MISFFIGLISGVIIGVIVTTVIVLERRCR